MKQARDPLNEAERALVEAMNHRFALQSWEPDKTEFPALSTFEDLARYLLSDRPGYGLVTREQYDEAIAKEQAWARHWLQRVKRLEYELEQAKEALGAAEGKRR